TGRAIRLDALKVGITDDHVSVGRERSPQRDQGLHLDAPQVELGRNGFSGVKPNLPPSQLPPRAPAEENHVRALWLVEILVEARQTQDWVARIDAEHENRPTPAALGIFPSGRIDFEWRHGHDLWMGTEPIEIPPRERLHPEQGFGGAADH